MLLARLFGACVGCLAILWGLAVLPGMWRQSPGERIATRLIAGESFRRTELVEQLYRIEPADPAAACRSLSARSAAIIRLRLAEDSIAAGERELIDADIESLQRTIRSALACSPSEPMLWFMLYWTEATLNGFSPDYFAYLAMSYRLGPNEGWIALERNRFAFAVYEYLPKNLAEAAVNEFVGLLKTGRLYAQSVEIFAGPARRAREAILPRLVEVGPRERQAFARALHSAGYDIAIPGTEPPKPRG